MTKNEITWEQLLASLNDANAKPTDKAWNIYYYMQANVGTDSLSSEEARTLLLCYMKLPVQRPSLVHSLMLSVAVKMREAYADFKFVNFLNLWGVGNLREEDMKPQTGKDGKVYASLIEKITKAYISYKMVHKEEELDKLFRKIINTEAVRLGFRPTMQMIAIKMFESEQGGRKLRSVKMVSADGDELLVDWHNFNAKPWEIIGKMYDVVPRMSKNENIRAEYITESSKQIAEVFAPTVGFVEYYAQEHGHYHIYDNLSRHFVAEMPKIKPRVGDFVLFSPVIPKVDKFKSAVVLKVLDKYEGREKFGAQSATVQILNKEKGFIKYKTEEGAEGFCNLDRCPKDIKQGDSIRLILFLKRGKDREKRPYVGEAY